MSKLHYLTALLIVILLAIASGWLFESIENNPVLIEEKIRHDPDYFFTEFTATTMNSNGKPNYKVTAKYLEHYPDDDSMKLQFPLFSFYENNIKTWTAQAHEAIIIQKGEKIHLSGEVILNQIKISKNDIPAILTTEQLTIETNQDIAHTKSKIRLRRGKNTIDAIGMRVDLNENRIEFFSKTRSHYVLVKK